MKSTPHTARSLRRIRRERRTVALMIQMFCHDRHGTKRGTLCEDCQHLHDYAMQRIDKCPFCLNKPTCANCPVHCYKKDMRAAVKETMRYAGPRMLLRHPILAILHQIDGRRVVELPTKTSAPAPAEQRAVS